MRMAFLADLYDYLNKLNSSLQGCNENLLIAADKMQAFTEKLQVWRSKITQNNLSMFPQTAACKVDAHMTPLILDSIIVLEDKIREYFPNIDIEKYDWVRDPFHI